MRETSNNAFTHRRRFGKEATATEPLGIQIRNRVPICPEIFDRSIDRFSFDVLAIACGTCRLVLSLRFQVQGREQKALGHYLGFFPRLDLHVDRISRNGLF